MKLWIFLPLFLLSGCFSTGFAPTGADTYMISRTSFACGMGSPSNVKAGLYKKAAKHCDKQGKVIEGISESQAGGFIGSCARAEIEFRCADQ